MVYCNFNQYKCENYAADLCNNNFKNNFDVAIASIGIKKDHINSSYIYSDIDNEQQNPTLWFLSAISNIKIIVSILDLPTSTIVFYYNRN